MFSLLTMNDWSGIYYVSYYGCDVYNGGYYNQDDLDPSWRCDNPGALPGFAVLYCTSFVLIAGTVMLSMFIGTISLAMGESIKGLNEATRLSKQAERKRKHEAKKTQRQFEKDNPNLEKSVALENADRLLHATLRQVMLNDVNAVYEEKLETTLFRRRLVRCGAGARKIQKMRVFKMLTVAAVFLSAFVVLLSTYSEVGITDEAGKVENVIQVAIEIFSSVIFTVECVVTILTFEVRPWLYFKVPLNNFDFLVLMGSFGVLPGGTQFWMLVRLIRLLLILKLAKKAPGLRIAVGTLTCGAASLTYVFALLLATYFLFGNIAYLIFSDNDPFHFKNLHISMVTLFRVSIMDNWIQVLYINMYGCDRYGYEGNPDRLGMCTMSSPAPLAAPLFFMFYILIATFVMLNLFIGVVCIAMEEASALVTEELDLDRQVKMVIRKHHWTKEQFGQARDVYFMINTDGDGGIEVAELETAIVDSGISIPSSEIEQAVYAIGGSDMSINLSEWVEFLVLRKQFKTLKNSASGGFISTRARGKLSGWATKGKKPKSLDSAVAATLVQLGKIPATAVEAKLAVSLVQFLTVLSDPNWVPFDPSVLAKGILPEIVSPEVKTVVQRRKRGQPNLVVEQMAASVAVERQQRSQPIGLIELTAEPVVVHRRSNSESRPQPTRPQPTQAAVEMETQSADAQLDADLFCQSVAPGVVQQVYVFHDDLPELATLVVADEGIQFVSNGNSQSEQQVLLAIRWPQVAFWAPRNRPVIAGVPSMDMLLLGILAGTDVLLEPKPAIRRAQSVIKMDVTDLSVLRPALEQHRPLASPPAAGPTEPMDRVLANGPSCLFYPLPSVWQPEPPEEAALRACSSGLQLTTADEEPQVLSAWRWEDVTFWSVSSGSIPEALDILVLGLCNVAGGPSGNPMMIFCAEVEETDEALAMLEAYCPSFVDHEMSVAANATAMQNTAHHEITAFEVFSFAEIPACGQFGPVALESHLRMHIDPKTGVSLYSHEGVWDGGLLPSFHPLVYRWHWDVLSNWACHSGVTDDVFLEAGEQAMDVFRVVVSNEVSAGPVYFETEDGDGIIQCFASMPTAPMVSVVTSEATAAADHSRVIVEPTMAMI
jgi:voltage-gated sodium channel